MVSNAAISLQTYFGCAVPKHIEIHPLAKFVTKGCEKMMKIGLERAVV